MFIAVGGIYHSISGAFRLEETSYGFIFGYAYLSYSLVSLSVCGFIAATYSWYNNTAYPSEL